MRGLGFPGVALCSDCNTLAEDVRDEELVSDCRNCCPEDSDDSTVRKYLNMEPILEEGQGLYGWWMHNEVAGTAVVTVTFSGAILEVCMRKLIFYPEVASFIEEENDKFPYVKIRYVYASPPKLIMLDSDNNRKETIRIDNWKSEHIQQFLREKVKSGGRVSAI